MKVVIYITRNKTVNQELLRLGTFLKENIKGYDFVYVFTPNLKNENFLAKIFWTLKTLFAHKRKSYGLIINSERVTGIEGIVLSGLAKKSLHTISYQISKPTHQFVLNCKKQTQNYRGSLLSKIFRAVYPLNFDDGLPFFSNKEILIRFIFNSKLLNPWIEGSTFIDEIWLQDNFSKSMFEKSGKLLTLMGSVQKHELFLKNKKKKIKNKVAFAIPQLFEHNLMTKHDAFTELSKIKDIFIKYDGCLEFVACLHPKQSKSDYLWLNDINIRVSEKSLLEEIVDSESLISAFQSVIDWARLLEIPTIQLNYLAFGLDSEAKGVFNIYDISQLHNCLSQLAENRLESSKVETELLPFDSRMAERIESSLSAITNTDN